jgi:hypothetical protein
VFKVCKYLQKLIKINKVVSFIERYTNMSIIDSSKIYAEFVEFSNNLVSRLEARCFHIDSDSVEMLGLVGRDLVSEFLGL